jgi:RNA polymerase sigma-70 factor (ECF subfamily)
MTSMGATEAELFGAERPRLLGLAYRLLGSMADAEDVVQEAWFRFDRADRSTIERPAAWLTTVVSRLGLDRLRARQRDRADYVGPWLPEPVVDESLDPADQAQLADSLTTAFLVLLEALTPTERLAVLLADVFGESFADVAVVLDRSEAAARQLASRARRKLRAADPTVAAGLTSGPLADQHAVAARFAAAVAGGDIEAAAHLLAPDVVLLSDGGPETKAARRPVVGRERVARFVINMSKRLDDLGTPTPCVLNHRPAIVTHRDGVATLALVFEVVDGTVYRLHAVNNPAKLAFVDHAPPLR